MKNIKFTLLVLLIMQVVFVSCRKNEEEKIAVIWTDQTDFVSYCEVFNNSQDKYKIIVEYKENPADAIINANIQPDIVIGPWLKGKSARVNFKNISNLFGENKIDKRAFYPELLNLGNISNTQYLLPVSFNLPMIIFSSSIKSQIKNTFTISPDEMREAARQFNKHKNNIYSNMGFSPRWSEDFLYMTVKGFNTSFEEENDFFTWDDKALKNAIKYIRDWSKEVNSSAQAEDEFKFKYLYEPAYSIVQSGRCLFYCLSSKDLFSIPSKKLENIDFRWLSFNDKILLYDDMVYAGICNKAKNKKVAEAFFIWFFNEETQHTLISRAHNMKLMVSSFALAGGFSGLHQVTEEILPKQYPLLLAHLPQTGNIYVPHILPSNWVKLKKEILMPYINEACNHENSYKEIPSLNKRIKNSNF